MDALHTSVEFGIGGSWLAEYTLRAAGAGIVVFDGSGRATQWNELAIACIGCDERDVPGRRLIDWCPIAIRRDGSVVGSADDPVERCIVDGGAVELVELGFVAASGYRSWCAISILPIPGPDGTPTAALASVRDITGIVEAERSILTATSRPSIPSYDSAAELIFGGNGELLYWNDLAVGATGYSEVELLVMRFDDLFDLDVAWVSDRITVQPDGIVQGRTVLIRSTGQALVAMACFRRVGWAHDEAAVQARIVVDADPIGGDRAHSGRNGIET